MPACLPGIQETFSGLTQSAPVTNQRMMDVTQCEVKTKLEWKVVCDERIWVSLLFMRGVVTTNKLESFHPADCISANFYVANA